MVVYFDISIYLNQKWSSIKENIQDKLHHYSRSCTHLDTRKPVEEYKMEDTAGDNQKDIPGHHTLAATQ